jgi:hypothetical protein
MNPARKLAHAVVVLVIVSPLYCSCLFAAEGKSWLFPDIRMRMPVTVKAGIYARKDALVRWNVNFTDLLKAAGARERFDTYSIRVAAEDEKGTQKEIPCAFYPAEGFDRQTTAAGELVWQVPGEMEQLDSRSYWVYFDTVGAVPRKPTHYPPIPGADQRPLNAVRNPGFEQTDPNDPTKPAEWAKNEMNSPTKSRGTIEIVHDPVHSGKNALKLHCTEGNMFGCRQEKVPMKPNALYRIGVWARSEPTKPGERFDHAHRPELVEGEMMMYISASLSQASGKPVETPQTRFDVSDSPPPDRWMALRKLGLYPYRSNVPTPPDTAYCQLNINLYGDSKRGRTAVGVVYIDDVEVIEVRPADKVPAMEVEAGAVEKRSGK